MTLILVIGTIAAVPASAGGRAPSVESQKPVETSHGGWATATADAPADRTPEVNYWHRHSLYWKHKAGQWRQAFLRLRHDRAHSGAAQGGASRASHGSSPRAVICSVFGAHCSEALRVAQCESRFNIYARNPNPPDGDKGDYLGLFQFGDFARARYGFAWNAWAQARSAYRYFLDAGWSPWQCRP